LQRNEKETAKYKEKLYTKQYKKYKIYEIENKHKKQKNKQKN